MGSGSSKKANTVVIGLDNSGKTTLINCVLPTKSVDISPTVGFEAHKFKKNKVVFNVFDMSGLSQCRTIWEKYYSDAKVLLSPGHHIRYRFRRQTESANSKERARTASRELRYAIT